MTEIHPHDDAVAIRRPKTSAPVGDQFLARWSPRSLLAEPLPEGHVQALLEAMRWSPSCFNEQPWEIVYATSETDRARIAECLADANRVWAAKAPFLAVIAARKSFTQNGKPNRWAGFDCGAAWMSLALQAERLGYRAHGMGGFDVDKAHELLGIPRDTHEPIAALAVGLQGPVDALPEKLQEREKPSDRRALAEFAFEGRHAGG